MKIEIKKEKKQPSTLKLGADLKKKGISIENVYVDGTLVGIVGISSDADRQRVEDTLSRALEENNGNLVAAASMLMELGKISEAEISPDEEVTVKGKTYYISYKEYKVYDKACNVVADCDDLSAEVKKAMPKEAVKALLVARVK